MTRSNQFASDWSAPYCPPNFLLVEEDVDRAEIAFLRSESNIQ